MQCTYLFIYLLFAEKDYQRPKRVCPFCPSITFHTQLPRHISKKHKELQEVTEALLLPKQSKERELAFENFRKRGIFRYNEAQAQEENPIYLSERKQQKDLVCCSRCKGFYGRALFHRHKDRCIGDTACEPSKINIETLQKKDKKFSELVLSKFQRDEVGKICQNDPTILLVGSVLFEAIKKKPDRIMETKKNVMNDMRLLARLYQVVKETAECQTAEDMFVRKNFPALEKAIEFVTKEEERLKHGTKQHLYYLILNAHEIIVSHHLSMDNDERAEEIEKFQRVFKLKKSTLFGDAIYAIHMNRQEKLRMPEEQADEEDIKALQTFICETIKKHSSPFEMFGQHEFVNLRDSICSRLTLFNARRGGEPARLTIKQYLDAKSGRWINQKKVKQLDAWEKDLFKSMLVTYQAGKGTHLVDDLIPNDCVKGLDLLVDSDIRKKAGIPSGNVFIFANTQGSTFHVSGWDAINKMCLGAKVKKPELLTATKQRHRISTLYSALDVPESEREYFYKHMGHSKAVNLGTYQYPLPVMAVTKVGRHLQAIDKGICFYK